MAPRVLNRSQPTSRWQGTTLCRVCAQLALEHNVFAQFVPQRQYGASQSALHAHSRLVLEHTRKRSRFVFNFAPFSCSTVVTVILLKGERNAVAFRLQIWLARMCALVPLV